MDGSLGGMDVDTASIFEEENVPDCLNTASTGHGVEIGRDKLSAKYLAEGRHANDVGSVQANHPVPKKCLIYYYEIEVVDNGYGGAIAIGFADKSFKLTKQPGWEASSYGYHGDDGRKYHASGKGEEYGPGFTKGDTVGAGIHMGKKEMFFTKNGVKLKTAFRNVMGVLYPTMGLHSKNEAIRVNFKGPFRFDLEGLIIDERAAQRAALDRIPIGAGVTHALVRDFLSHYGYAKTMNAFDALAGAGAPGCNTVGRDLENSNVAANAGAKVAAARGGGGGSGGGGFKEVSDMEIDGEDAGEPGGARAADGGGVLGARGVDGGKVSAGSDKLCGNEEGEDGEGGAQAGGGGGGCDDALALRHGLRGLIESGNTAQALEALRAAYPQILREHSGFERIQFHLYCQQYIELLRKGCIHEALAFAKSSLPALLEELPQYKAQLQDVVALVAYEHPEKSPLGQLMSLKQRELAADLANAAVLAASRGSDPRELPKSALEQTLCQLVVAHSELMEQNGGQGEALRLRDYMIE